MNGKLVTYYIPLPQAQPERHKLETMLDALSEYYPHEERSFLQIRSGWSEVDPILSKLADHVVRPDPPPEAAQPDPQAKPPKSRLRKREPRTFMIVGRNGYYSRAELDMMFQDGDLPEGARVESRIARHGPWLVSGRKGHLNLVRITDDKNEAALLEEVYEHRDEH